MRKKECLNIFVGRFYAIVKRSVSTITLPSRTGQLIEPTDVLVVGGGPAGLGAAIGAANAGAKVILAEQYGFLGGHATAALLLTFASYYASSTFIKEQREFELFPTDHGVGPSIVGGVLERLIERLVKAGGAIPPSYETGYVVPFDPKIFKLVILDMVNEAGAELLFHALASGVINHEGLRGVVFETKSGPIVIKAKNIIDCTGDGDVAAFAGASYEVGREEDGYTQPMTLLFVMEGFQKKLFQKYVEQHPDEWSGVQGLRTLMEEARKRRELDIPRGDILFFGTMHEDKVNVNSVRITRVSGIDVLDLTYAEVEGRRQIKQIANFLRKYVPGFEKAYVAQSGTTVGVRETRRIIGEYKLTSEDIVEARKFEGAIAHSAYPIDIHNPTGKGSTFKRLTPREWYDIPLRCLIPLEIENLLVAGRCISGTNEASASYRVMATCMATGQAAGVWAALASRSDQTPRNVAYLEVKKELIRQGSVS